MQHLEDTPIYLYKYKSVDYEGNWKKIISDSNIYFPSPDKFNDPFECKPRFHYHATRNEKISAVADQLAYIYAKGERIEPALKRLYIEMARKEVDKGNYDTKKRVKIENDIHERINKEYGLLSLTINKANPLMWSHYTDSHKGLCFEFDTRKAVDFFSLSRNVIYHKERKTYNYFKLTPGGLHHAVLYIKSYHWEYEQEWRVMTTKPNTIHSFPPRALTAIYMGINFSRENEETVIELAKKKKHKIKLYKAKIAHDKFDLEFEEITY